MKKRFLFIYILIILCLIMSDLSGQPDNKQLRDTSIILLKNLKKFSTYRLTYIKKFQPLFSQPGRIDTTKVSYNNDTSANKLEFSLYTLNNVLGFVRDDSCRFYYVEGTTLSSSKKILCQSCKHYLSDFLYYPLISDEWLNNCLKDLSLKISVKYNKDTILLMLSKVNILPHNEGYAYVNVNYYFNSKDGFPLRFVETIEINDDIQKKEYRVINYTLDHDPNLQEFLSKLFSQGPSINPSIWLSYE